MTHLRTFTRSALLSLGFAALAPTPGCEEASREAERGPKAAEGNAMKTSDDPAALRRLITVPAGLNRVRWAARPRGATGLGPTDLELVAFFPVDEDEWQDLLAELGQPGEPASARAPTDLLAALGFAGSRPGGRTLPCEPFAHVRWTCTQALATGQGVLVWLRSR